MTDKPTTKHRAVQFSLLIGLAGAVAFFIWKVTGQDQGFSWLWDGVVYHLPIAAGAASLLLLVRRSTGSVRTGWVFLLIAYVIWSQGSLWWKLVQQRDGRVAAFSGFDGVRLVLYPLAIVGLAYLSGVVGAPKRVDQQRSDQSAWSNRRLLLETFAAALATTSLCITAAGSAIDANPLNRWESLTNLVYPIGDGIVLILVVTIAAHRRWRMRSTWWVLLTALACRFVANLVYLSSVDSLPNRGSSARDVVWPLTAMGIAFAGHAPRSTRNPSSHLVTRLSVLPLLVGVAAMMVAVLDAPPLAIALGLVALLMVLFGVVVSSYEDAQREAIGAAALRDPLTSLPNRNGFLLTVETMRKPFNLLITDIIGFRDVNETLGRDAGDEALIVISQRLRQSLPGEAVVARLSGDEFCVAVPVAMSTNGLATPEALCALVTKVFETPLDLSVAAGISLTPVSGAVHAEAQGSHSALDLLRFADTALVSARIEPRPFVIYDAELARLNEQRRSFAQSLEGEAPATELVVFLQPKVELLSGAIVGAEALARWAHPELGILPPGMFLNSLNGRQRQGLTRMMLRGVLAALSSTAQHRSFVPVAINLTASDLMNRHFSDEVFQELARYDVHPSMITVELTEEEIMRDWKRCAVELERLRSRGIRVAIDDFGTGYSSLAVLHRLPFDEVKLDRAFLDDLQTSASARTTLQSIMAITQGLGVDVVAEGIEQQTDRQLLIDVGCPYAQGYLFSKPISVADFDALLSRNAPLG
jgi:diguanylate cyclase